MGDVQKISGFSFMRKSYLIAEGTIASRHLYMDRDVSLNTVEMRIFFFFCLWLQASLKTSGWFLINFIFFLLQNLPWDFRYQALWHREQSGWPQTTFALGKSMLSSADCFLLLHIPRCGCQEDPFPERAFTVCFSYCTSSLLMLLYPLRYLRCCITFICSLHSQTRRLMPNTNIYQMQKLSKKQKTRGFS